LAVFDASNDSMALYVDGALIGTTAWTGSLSEVNALNNWLGHSQFSADPDFDGSLDEFRIYDVALDAEQALYSFEAGRDASFLD
jgi:hypothetical protein